MVAESMGRGRRAPTGGGYAGPLTLLAVDATWLAPLIWLLGVAVGHDGARMAFGACLLYGLGLAAGRGLASWAPRSGVGLGIATALGGLAVGLSLWPILYPSYSPLDSVWIRTAAEAIADTPFAFPAELVSLAAGAALYGRGLWASCKTVSHRTVAASFQVGLFALVLVVLFAGDDFALHSAGFVLVYFAVGLIGLAASRRRERGVLTSFASGLWVAPQTAGIILASLLVVAVALVAAPVIIAAASAVIFAVLAMVEAVFRWLFEAFGSPDYEPPPDSLAPPPMRGEQGLLRELIFIPDHIRRVCGYGVIGLFLAPMMFVLARYLAAMWRRLWDPLFAKDVVIERIEWSSGGWRQWIRLLLYRLGRGLWRLTGGRTLDGDPSGWPVRLAYRDLLKVAARRGAPRAPGNTAREHLPALAAVFPGYADELAQITESYERNRYGPSPRPSEAPAMVSRCRSVTRRGWWRRNRSKAMDG